MNAPALPAPWSWRDGRLAFGASPLGPIVDLLVQEQASAAWVVDHEAVVAAAGAAGTLAVATIPQDELLALAADAGAHARVFSGDDLRRARRAGFEPARVRVDGRVKDDGLLLAALSAQVAAIVSYDEQERANLERIARTLDLRVPPEVPARERGPSEAARAGAFAACGGLLARVLRGGPVVQLDVSLTGWDADEVLLVPLAPGEAAPARLLGLSGATTGERGPCAVLCLGALARGDWVALPTGAAVVRGPCDPSHAPLGTVLVRGGRVRWLDPTPPSASST